MAVQAPNLHHPALLLLPATAVQTFSGLKNSNGPHLSKVLLELFVGVKGTSLSAVLDIALAISGLPSPSAQHWSNCFEHLQQQLANIYRLVGIISAERSIDLDGPGGIDVRVFFVDCTKRNPSDSQGSSHIPQLGPVTTFVDLLTSGRTWEVVYSLDSPTGRIALRHLKEAVNQLPPSNSQPNIQELSTGGGIIYPMSMRETDTHSIPHYSVAVGGTFDHLHTGHKLLLTATILALDPYVGQTPSQRRIVTIGITGDEMLVNKKYAEYLESWEERWQGVWAFFQSIVDFFPVSGGRQTNMERISNPGPNGKRVVISVGSGLEFRFVQIADPFGPTITDEDITALVVSKETRSGGKAVNEERGKRGWAALEVFEVDVLGLSEDVKEQTETPEENFESKISSTEIRKRRMNLSKGSPCL